MRGGCLDGAGRTLAIPRRYGPRHVGVGHEEGGGVPDIFYLTDPADRRGLSSVLAEPFARLIVEEVPRVAVYETGLDCADPQRPQLQRQGPRERFDPKFTRSLWRPA